MNESIIVSISEALPRAAKYRPLYCFMCCKTTVHEKRGNVYVCDCGAELLHIENVAPAMYAMDLRASKESQDRFSEWAQELLSHE